MPTENLPQDATNVDEPFLEKVDLDGGKYNIILRWNPAIKTPGYIYNKSVLIDSRLYNPNEDDLKRKNVSGSCLTYLLPISDPANDGDALGYKTYPWNNDNFVGKAHDWIDPRTSSPATYMTIVKRPDRPDLKQHCAIELETSFVVKFYLDEYRETWHSTNLSSYIPTGLPATIASKYKVNPVHV